MRSQVNYQLILASRSPRRKEMIGYLEIPFHIMTMGIPEISHHKRPSLFVKDLAKQKAHAVIEELAKKAPPKKKALPLVIGSDTIVALKNEILGIPKDVKHAREILKKLSGKTHQVYTGVYLALVGLENKVIKESSFYCKTDVIFHKIDQDLLENYLRSGDPFDKAGAYGIQGNGLTFIKSIKGSYSNVVGLPILEVHQELKKIIGFEKDDKGKWRSRFL